MGTDFGDYDGDGKLDLFVTNIELEPNNLYHNNGDETFTDVTVQAHLGGVARLSSGFGTRFVDYDSKRINRWRLRQRWGSGCVAH